MSLQQCTCSGSGSLLQATLTIMLMSLQLDLGACVVSIDVHCMQSATFDDLSTNFPDGWLAKVLMQHDV